MAVLSLTFEEALYGFKKKWVHLDESTELVIERTELSQPGLVVKLSGKGMYNPTDRKHGDLYVRLELVLDKPPSDSYTVSKAAPNSVPRLHREERVKWEDGLAWRRWNEMSNAVQLSKGGKQKKGQGEL